MCVKSLLSCHFLASSHSLLLSFCSQQPGRPCQLTRCRPTKRFRPGSGRSHFPRAPPLGWTAWDGGGRCEHPIVSLTGPLFGVSPFSNWCGALALTLQLNRGVQFTVDFPPVSGPGSCFLTVRKALLRNWVCHQLSCPGCALCVITVARSMGSLLLSVRLSVPAGRQRPRMQARGFALTFLKLFLDI